MDNIAEIKASTTEHEAKTKTYLEEIDRFVDETKFALRSNHETLNNFKKLIAQNTE